MSTKKVQYNINVKDNEDTVESKGCFDTIEEASKCLTDFVNSHNSLCTAFPYELQNMGSFNYRSDNDKFHAYIERYVLDETKTEYNIDYNLRKEYKELFPDLPIRSFNVLVVGNPKVGKSTWITRLRTGEFTKEYVPNLHQTFSTLRFNTTEGLIEIHIKEHTEINDHWRVDGTIVICDATDIDSFKDAIKLIDLRKTKQVFVCNKVDLKDRVVLPKDILSFDFLKRKIIPWYEISAKSNYQFEKPFLSLIRQMMNDYSIKFVPEEAIEPPEAFLRNMDDLVLRESFNSAYLPYTKEQLITESLARMI